MCRLILLCCNKVLKTRINCDGNFKVDIGSSANEWIVEYYILILYISVCPFKKCRIIFSIPAVSMATHNLIMCTLSIVCDGKGQQRFQLNVWMLITCPVCVWVLNLHVKSATDIKCKRQVKASAGCWAKIKKKALDSAHVNDRTYLLWVQSLI